MTVNENVLCKSHTSMQNIFLNVPSAERKETLMFSGNLNRPKGSFSFTKSFSILKEKNLEIQLNSTIKNCYIVLFRFIATKCSTLELWTPFNVI